MKKSLGIIIVAAVLIFLAYYGIYYKGYYLNLDQLVSSENTIVLRNKIQNEKILLLQEDGSYEEFFIKAVEVSNFKPGYSSTSNTISEDTYLRWFTQISEMGANTVRISNIFDDTFYNALYEFNQGKESPLYLLQGITISDYANNNSRDAYSNDFYGALKENGRNVIDVIHGKKNIDTNQGFGSGKYRKDISDWVLGYIIGTDWNAETIAYTNHQPYEDTFEGKYVKTKENSTKFEVLLAKVIESMISYETEKYQEQRILSIASHPKIDPFEYDSFYAKQLGKHSEFDMEHLESLPAYESGMFAFYNLYQFTDEFYSYFSSEQKEKLVSIYSKKSSTYLYGGYTELLNQYHSIPVIVSYSVSSARGAESGTPLTEKEQGNLLLKGYEDFLATGCEGVVISGWQDIWGKTTWNTIYSVELQNKQYWYDTQSSKLGTGLLSLEPGEMKPICIIDGSNDEWGQEDILLENESGRLSVKYDEGYLYLLVEPNRESFMASQNNRPIYLPFDITPKTGSAYAAGYGVSFSENADFLLILDGKYNSRLLVQERYEAIRANFSMEIDGVNAYVSPPAKDSNRFVPIHLLLDSKEVIDAEDSD